MDVLAAEEADARDYARAQEEAMRRHQAREEEMQREAEEERRRRAAAENRPRARNVAEERGHDAARARATYAEAQEPAASRNDPEIEAILHDLRRAR